MNVVVALATLLYPIGVWIGAGHLEPRYMAWGLLALALTRAVVARQVFWWAAAVGAGLLALLSVWGNVLQPLKLYPALVNAVFLGVFGVSLIRPPSAVERMARLTEPDLPPQAVLYTRQVTKVWCVFFVLNGSAAVVTAVWASDEIWAFYNGFLAYVLIGSLFAVEWCVRQRVRGRQMAASAAKVGHD